MNKEWLYRDFWYTLMNFWLHFFFRLHLCVIKIKVWGFVDPNVLELSQQERQQQQQQVSKHHRNHSTRFFPFLKPHIYENLFAYVSHKLCMRDAILAEKYPTFVKNAYNVICLNFIFLNYKIFVVKTRTHIHQAPIQTIVGTLNWIFVEPWGVFLSYIFFCAILK